MTAPRIARVTQPLCVECSHPRSFHAGGGECKALGCTTCKAYVSPLTQQAQADAEVAYPYPGKTDLVVRAGQIWADNDPRRQGKRKVRIERFEGEGEEQVAVVTITETDAPKHTGSGVGAVKKIKVRRFRPTSNGYVLAGEG